MHAIVDLLSCLVWTSLCTTPRPSRRCTPKHGGQAVGRTAPQDQFVKTKIRTGGQPALTRAEATEPRARDAMQERSVANQGRAVQL